MYAMMPAPTTARPMIATIGSLRELSTAVPPSTTVDCRRGSGLWHVGHGPARGTTATPHQGHAGPVIPERIPCAGPPSPNTSQFGQIPEAEQQRAADAPTPIAASRL